MSILQLEYDSKGLVSYTVYGTPSPSITKFPEYWPRFELSSARPYATVSTVDYSALSGFVGAITAFPLLLGGTLASVTTDVSGDGSILRASDTTTTTISDAVKAACSISDVDASPVTSAMALLGLDKAQLTSRTEVAFYASSLSNRPSIDVNSMKDVFSLLKKISGFSYGLLFRSQVALGAPGRELSATLEVLAAFVGKPKVRVSDRQGWFGLPGWRQPCLCVRAG